MTANTIVIWHPERLNARLVLAARPAAAEVARAAAVRAPGKIGATVRSFGGPTDFAVGSPLPEAGFVEKGTPPHEIEGKRGFLRLADGSFVSGPVQHPGMRARPFLRPAMTLWPALYRRQAARAFRGL